MSDVVKEVDQARDQSNELIENMLTGEKPVAVHEAMIALQQADVAFELMNRVRTKLVRAYEEVMRTPV
jgi:flagellar hook-basal body complex protein FliE